MTFKVLSMNKIELNSILMQDLIASDRTILTFKLCTYVKLNRLKLEYMYKNAFGIK